MTHITTISEPGQAPMPPCEGCPEAIRSDVIHDAVGITFGAAIEALKLGKRVARAGWNGKGMWLAYVQPFKDAIHSKTPCFSYRAFGLPNGSSDDAEKSPELLPWIGMKTADDKFVPWLASQTDVLAEDWVVVA